MFRDHLSYAPKKVYTDATKEEEIINEMNTAEWWWEVQVRFACILSQPLALTFAQKQLPSGATVAPIILASDKTQLSTFSGDKQAWPVYLSIGNISKSIRRQPSKQATVLLGYLPVTKLECISENDRKEKAYRLFHFGMSLMLKPLIHAGSKGTLMVCADKRIRRVFPILASYIADYPEQCLVACNKENACPICLIRPKQRGEPVDAPARQPKKILKVLQRQQNGDAPSRYKVWNLRPVYEPFWAKLPHTNIFKCFTPDLLHQLHKGVFKDHIVKWCIQVAGPHGAKEIDQRFKAMPSYPGIRHFNKGISLITQWTGREYKEMERVFASLIHGAVPSEVSAVARAVVDFVYYASFQSHSTETLRRLQDALDTFHEYKSVFVERGVRDHFRIPKIHMMEHYVELIRLKGSADGFNTEISERLHIDFAKVGYRASNKKEYIKQMISFLTRQEKLHRFASFLTWREAIEKKAAEDAKDNTAAPKEQEIRNERGDAKAQHQEENDQEMEGSGLWQLAKEPQCPKVSLNSLVDTHQTIDIVNELTTYLKTNVPACRVQPSDHDFVDVYTRMSTIQPSPQGLSDDSRRDVVRASPAKPETGKKKAEIAHFDTVLVHEGTNAENIGLEGYRAARVRAIFRLPTWFSCPQTLAYVEWYTQFTEPVEHLRMSQVSVSTRQRRKRAAVIPISSIRCSCFLSPKFNRRCEKNWTTNNVLDQCTQFYLNSHLNLYMFQICDGDFVLNPEAV
jgi:hypothetical protein